MTLRLPLIAALAVGLAACGTDDAPVAEATDDGVSTAGTFADAPEIPAGEYTIDTAHSRAAFRVRHLGISNVDGTFNDFSGTVTIPETGLEGMTAMLTAQVASIDTDNERRNGHLRSPDFFAADEYPELTFQTTSITPTGGTSFEMTGDLTMRGTTRSVTLQGEYLGAAEIGGTQKIGFEASGEINRQDWGLSWAETNDAGEVIVADTVTLMIGVEADLQGDDAMAEEDAEADA